MHSNCNNSEVYKMAIYRNKQYAIQTATSVTERESIYRFRYKVYIEEMRKTHIQADHGKKMLHDRLDESAVLYFVSQNDTVIATARSQRGTECIFTQSDIEFFGIRRFQDYISREKIAVVDRLIVDKKHRNHILAREIMLATYLGGLEAGIKICFITCDDSLLSMYLRYGFRIYAEPVELPGGEIRNRLVLFLCDREHLQKVKSPFLPYLPEEMDDKKYYLSLIREQLGFTPEDD